MAEKLIPSPDVPPVDRLVHLINILTGENGCPWDKKQTPESAGRHLIEEAHELVDAILSRDAQAICEETGDVLFQIFFIIHLFRIRGDFDVKDVVDANLEKMIRRHPHVFGDASADTPEAVLENWRKIKKTEKPQTPLSVLDGIPQSLPGLMRAALVSERAAATGFDWPDLKGVMATARAEWSEFSHAIDANGRVISADAAEDELGDVLFTLVNVARFASIHPEMALVRSIRKFEARFRWMEDQCRKDNIEFSSLDFTQMHQLWDQAKKELTPAHSEIS
ncbi:nucleoside triphosphate pyrophosphohydrolase [Desulfosarcina sp. OttesenSCG-928-A07]|nr:nucleoside triphosphate pyrophosphohydrolase [Desulfosarcina sp. OttesenSCG-928-G17]MDL2329285.1 nucleoside triphosphate pyrophosphohydrolase [Desulfosarcina sp. OttesenSCG-928-A07]